MRKEKPFVTRDLFTGELRPLVLKAGGGSHIRLRHAFGELTAVPGMAHFLGSGPAGKVCRDCEHLGDLEVKPPESEKWRQSRIERDACRKARDLMGGVVQRGGIAQRAACKYFTPKDEA